MKKWILLPFLLVLLGGARAQSARLQLDPKWVSGVSHSKFAFVKPLMPAPSFQTKPIPQAWCYADLAFFCKIEVKMEKAARFPVKFRLGDVQYVDKLEGKRIGFYK